MRIKASHPDYPAIARKLHLLGVAVNPQCWQDVEYLAPPARAMYQAMLTEELDNLMVDVTFKELTHGLE
jgi:hypothetical protein